VVSLCVTGWLVYQILRGSLYQILREMWYSDGCQYALVDVCNGWGCTTCTRCTRCIRGLVYTHARAGWLIFTGPTGENIWYIWYIWYGVGGGR